MHFRSKSPSPEHWSKDFVEHLRTVHFALIALSIGLILLLSSTSYDARAVLTQIHEILQLRNLWTAKTISSGLLHDVKILKGTSHGHVDAGSDFSIDVTFDSKALSADRAVIPKRLYFRFT